MLLDWNVYAPDDGVDVDDWVEADCPERPEGGFALPDEVKSEALRWLNQVGLRYMRCTAYEVKTNDKGENYTDTGRTLQRYMVSANGEVLELSL